MNTPNSNNILKENLIKLNFLSEDGRETGLVFVSRRDTAQLSEIFALEKAEDFGATAVYFRRYKDKPENNNVSKCNSTHSILLTNETIELTHFWVTLKS